LFKKEIGNERVHTEWLNAEYAIAKAKETGKIRMLKTLAVINIINKFDEMPPTEEILKIASGLPNASEILNSLVAKELIYKKETNNCYVFKTRAGASLKSEIKRRRVLKDSVNLSQVFSDVSNNQYILPKRYNNTYSMTRYFRFEYLDVVDFLKLENVDVLLRDGKFQDGKVVALYSLDNSNRTEQIMKKVAELTSYNIIVIYAEKPFAMMDKARDYEIIQNIKSDDKFMKENEILSKELVVMEEDIEKILSNYLENEFEQMGSHITIYYDGDKWVLDTLKAWYEKQSDVAKHGLYNTSISGFMSCIGDIDTYDEYSVVQKIMKIVTEVHADSWNDDTYNEYVDKLQQLKNDIEAIGSENRKGSCVLSFTGKNGEVIQKYYDPVDSDEGTMFRNIIEDQLESFSDLDVNVRVAILLEMIEKVMRKEE